MCIYWVDQMKLTTALLQYLSGQEATAYVLVYVG